MGTVSPFLIDQDPELSQVFLYPEVVYLQLFGRLFVRAMGKDIIENLGKGYIQELESYLLTYLTISCLFLFS